MAGDSERYSEELVGQEMKFRYGENDFGFVYVQGEQTPISDINIALKEAGGKPKLCELDDMTKGGNGSAEPEFIITLKKDLNTILVVECKKDVKKHASVMPDKTTRYNKPYDYACDGALFYAKYLKKYFNVIAIGISGTNKNNFKANAFYWEKGKSTFSEIPKTDNIILEPINYLGRVRGEKIKKAYSLEDIKETAAQMHDSLRINKMTEKLKPLFVAGILIALQDEDFCNDYEEMTSFRNLLSSCESAIGDVLNDGDIPASKITEIKNKFAEVKTVLKLAKTPLSDDHSLRWYIKQLEQRVKPMMDYVGSTIDALGVFYHEFISYSSGDGNSLGIVLTPQHLTEFMAELININKESKVIDICCGSGAFLVTAMGIMFKEAKTDADIERIRKYNLYGIEQDADIHTLALANMIIRKDGKSHIIHGDCFDTKAIAQLKSMKDENGIPISFNKCLLNPPYSQKDHCELEFAEQALSLLAPGGQLAIVCPVSCANGTKFKEVRERLMEKHTLEAVFSMPDDIFYGNNASTNVCVMVWKAHSKHKSHVSTFLGRYKNDGFAKRKKIGRTDINKQWETIKSEWLSLYEEKECKDGMTLKQCLAHDASWMYEAYAEADYSTLTEKDFQKQVNDYAAYLLRTGKEPTLTYKPSCAPALDIYKWQKFKISDLFRYDRGKEKAPKQNPDGETPLISETRDNNGFNRCVVATQIFKGNALTISINCGNIVFYQPEEFCASVNIALITNDVLNVYNGLFIATLLRKEYEKFNYGVKNSKEAINNTIVKLPTKDDGTPDWKFMENYIKSLPYGDNL